MHKKSGRVLTLQQELAVILAVVIGILFAGIYAANHARADVPRCVTEVVTPAVVEVSHTERKLVHEEFTQWHFRTNLHEGPEGHAHEYGPWKIKADFTEKEAAWVKWFTGTPLAERYFESRVVKAVFADVKVIDVPAKAAVTKEVCKPIPTPTPTVTVTATPTPTVVTAPSKHCTTKVKLPITAANVTQISNCFSVKSGGWYEVKAGESWTTLAIRYQLPYQAFRILGNGSLDRLIAGRHVLVGTLVQPL